MDSVISYKADCLLSAVVTGRLFCSKGDPKGDDNQEDVIVWSEKLSTIEIIELLKNKSVKGMIVKNGSFAGHAAGFLNGRGVQLAIAPLFNPDLWERKTVRVDGNNNIIQLLSNVAEISVPEIEIKTGSNFRNGKNIKVYVDGKDEKELEAGFVNGADGVGILKTDWMGWDNDNPPSVEEHLNLYEQCLEKVGDNRLNIRLFDVGGDKIPKWANSAYEFIKSPIGYRGIRAKDVLRGAYDNQIKAICKVTEKVKLGVVLPMVTNIGEVREIKERFMKSDSEGFKNIIWGIMVEVPEAALNIKELLGECDFVRIGPGDLSQACLAMDRENISPKYYSRSNLSPGVLKLIKITAMECKKQEKEINICQDVEPNPELIQDIINAGVEIFCVSSSSVKHLRGIIDK